MLVHVPDHFSSHFKFDLKKFPACIIDRSSWLKSITGFILGFCLLGLGIFELFSFLSAGKNTNQSFLLVEVFSIFIIIIAISIMSGAVLSVIRYKKICFDGKTFSITYRPVLGIKYDFSEPLENYMGVRLRVLFTQAGLFNRNRYIIDLYHQDSNKIIPLYISTNNKNLRNIWESYAKLFKLPALSVSDRGLVQREYTDLDKSLKELSIAGKLPYIASGKFPAPNTLAIQETKDSTIISPIGIFWDIFSLFFLILAVSSIFILVAGGLYFTILGNNVPLPYLGIGAILLLATFYGLGRLFRSYSLCISKNEVIVSETFFNSVVTKDNLPINKIENIELSYNPTIDRYNLTIISDDKFITFGGRLPVNDLLWLKDFVIRKLIGN